jgi:murein DD-endopeptidase MepM/ murein hydrolase activator NlpD
MKKTPLLAIITLFILSSFHSPVFAQEDGEGPVYIVQPGENLSSIAQKFGIDVIDLISANNIVDTNLISAGTQLIIPGLNGISGVLSVTPIQLGETIPVILKKYQVSMDILTRLNKITSPSEAYVGTNLILPVSNLENSDQQNSVFTVGKNSSIFLNSIEKGLRHWSITLDSDMPVASIQVPKEPLNLPEIVNASNEYSGSIFSPHIQNIELKPLPFSQGHTVAFNIIHTKPLSLIGSFDGHPLVFYPDTSGQILYALDGVYALRSPGLAEFSLEGTFDSGETFNIDQMILIESGGYVNETLTVESTFINEELNIRESAKVQEILATTSPERYWTGTFRYPVDGALEDETIGFSSYFGNRRSYNNGEYFGFHGGLDFYVLLNSFNIYAPAPGVIAFAGPMDIRGFTIFIDHGQGVFSGYAHLSEILVEEGQFVNEGELIGLIGKTGRVTGPHLHWDIWVNGNQVDPFDWVYTEYP